MTPPVVCVVDSSVGIKLVIMEPDSSQAHNLFAHLTMDPAAQFWTPDLFYTECANILRTHVKRGLLSGSDAPAKLKDLQTLALRELPSAPLVADALRLALTYDLSAYDGLYVAASVQLGLPLITADDKLVRKLVGSPCKALLLSGLSIPVPPGP